MVIIILCGAGWGSGGGGRGGGERGGGWGWVGVGWGGRAGFNAFIAALSFENDQLEVRNFKS